MLNCALNDFCSGLKLHTSAGCYVLQDLTDRGLHTQTAMRVLTNVIKLDYFFPAKNWVWILKPRLCGCGAVKSSPEGVLRTTCMNTGSRGSRAGCGSGCSGPGLRLGLVGDGSNRDGSGLAAPTASGFQASLPGLWPRRWLCLKLFQNRRNEMLLLPLLSGLKASCKGSSRRRC